MGAVKHSEFRRGDENRPHPSGFGRLVEWYSSFPAPSLRELSSECETEGVSPDEWERLNILSFVGAMKIARNVTVSGRYIEWYPAG